MTNSEKADLLFFDTFSHDNSEDLNLDLVQFPKSVYVREIRVIPLGARVEGDFPGRVRLGATNPTKFHIDFFVNDLSKPGASTFEALGSLDYCQTGQIHMECGADGDHPRIPTDGLVLRGCYTTITLAVYGTLTQILPEAPVGVNPTIQRPTVNQDAPPPNVAQPPDWNPEPSNPIPSYTGNVASTNPDVYTPNNYPENYENPIYRTEYYENEPPKDPRAYHVDGDWEKNKDINREEGDRLPRSSRSMEHDRERQGHGRRRSADRRSRDSSRHRDERIERHRSRSRTREREYVVQGEYRTRSRSRSRSADRARPHSAERDWDKASHKKDEYRRHREPSYERTSYDKEAGPYERRSPYDKRAPSYERKIGYDKRSSPYKRGASYERRAPSYEKQPPHDRKRISPYGRIRSSSYGSRSPSRDDLRKRPRTPPGESRRPLSPRDGEATSPMHSVRSEDDYERSGKQIPRVDFYHQSYRHKPPIRSPSEEHAAPFVETHSSLVTVPIVDNLPKPETPSGNAEEDKSIDAEQFEPILSDEDICDDLESTSYMEVDYDVNEYVGVDDIIKYFNPFKAEWCKYEYINKIQYLGPKRDDVKDVLSAKFDDLCDVSPDLFKVLEISKKTDQKYFTDSFKDIDNTMREEWVHQCEQMYVSMTSLCRNTDIVVRIFQDPTPSDEFGEINKTLIAFCKIGLNFGYALSQQQPTYKIRHMKCGVRLAEALVAHKHNETVTRLLLAADMDLPVLLLQIYAEEYMALSIRLMVLKALDACLSSKIAIDNFMKEKLFPKFDKNEMERKPQNGYRALISMMRADPLARLKFSISALIKKLNIYEVLGKLHDLVADLNKKPDAEPSEADTEFIVNCFEIVIDMYRSQCFHLSQPKRFLPVSAQFDINKECSNDTLLAFFSIHSVLEVCLCLLTGPKTCNNLVVASPVHDLIYELVNSMSGLNFLYRNMELSELLFKTLAQPYNQQNAEEFLYPHDLSNYSDLQILGLEMAYKLRALYYLQSICDLQAGHGDENELIDRLQSLYCLSFGCIGRTAVSDVVVMGDHADCLMEVFENDSRKNKGDSPFKQKSPAKGYAIELIVSAVRFSANVTFLKKYGQRLINVSKDHDRFEPSVSSVLQEVIPYLKPVENMSLLNGDDLAECVEILKANSEHSADLPGELTTCLRVLRHFCVSDRDTTLAVANEAVAEEYVELKYKYNVLQLYSLDGVAHLGGVLGRLATRFDQPSMHTAFFASVKGLQLAQILVPCLRLLDEMLARVVRCRGPRFRDLTAAPVLLKTYGIAKSFPVGCVGYRTAARAAEAAVKALLSYAQPIADDANDGDSIRRGPWTSLCSEVIQYTMTAPYTFVPGLLVFSELLPLPLPMQAKTPPTPRELEDACNERRLWSAHLHALSGDLTDMIQIICMSTYRPVVHMLRRVCVQIADLAPNTAATVALAAVGAVAREVKPEEPATASSARVLGFLTCLVSHAPLKCAVLYALNTGGPKAAEIQAALCGVLSLPSAAGEHSTAQEFAAHILAALCDVDITLTPVSSLPDNLLANSLPNKEALAAFLDASADCLESSTKTCSVAQSVLRAYFVLTDHEYGFQQFRKFVTKKREALGTFFKWAVEGPGEDRAECLSLYLDLIRILKGEEGEGGPVVRKSVLTVTEMADMLGYSVGAEDHPIMSLEKILKDRNAEEDAAAARFLWGHLQGPARGSPAPEGPEPPPPDSLVAQFAARAATSPAAPADDRLSAGYWLNTPAAAGDTAHHHDLVPCDILEVANSYLSAGGGDALTSAVRRLAGCLDARTEPRSGDDKRPAVERGVRVARGRGEAPDAFRCRPPNTSRPPSLHVDDFTALHHTYTNPGSRGARRGADRGRFASAAPVHAHYRHTRGRGAWEAGAAHFGHYPPAPQYMLGGGGWAGGGRGPRGPRHRSFVR